MLAYVGWLIPFNAPLVLVTEDGSQADRVATDLLRIGYEEAPGFLPFEQWAAARPVAQLDTVTIAEAGRIRNGGELPVFDVRFDSDVRNLALPGAHHRPIDRLPEWLGGVTEGEMLTVCGAGSRAATAASLLQATGHRPRVLLDGGAAELVASAQALAAQSAGG